MTSVKNQDPYGTCWAFASCGSMESSLMPGESTDFSEDNMVLTSGFDTGSTPAEKYDSGGHIWMSTAYLTRWGGPVFESDDAYADSTTPPGLSPRKHVQDVFWVPQRASATDNDTIKNAVMAYGAAYVAMGWYGSSAGSSYYNAETKSYYYNGTSSANHGVLIAGWDDSYPAADFATTPPADGAFLVKNSWGTGWGDGGYFWVSYYDSTFGRTSPLAVFHGVQATSNYTGVYQYDPLGDVSEFGFTSNPTTAWLANVFTATYTSSLSAVGFYATAPGTSYEIYTGPNLAGKTLRTSGTLPYMGYHTVTLPTPTGVTGGQQFVVAVKLITPDYDYPIAVEYPVYGYSSTATAGVGQSYISSNGTSWSDLTTGVENANVCLKAYVTGGTPPPPDDDGDVPGVTVPPSPVSGSLAEGSDDDDVFRVNLTAGQTLDASISGPAGTDFDLYLFPPDQSTVVGHSGWVARAFAGSYPDSLSYVASQSGIYYLDANVWSGSGDYTITYSVHSADPDDDIPGVPAPPSPINGSIDDSVDTDDVYALNLNSGQTLTAGINGPPGSDLWLLLYAPSAVSVWPPDSPVVYTNSGDYPRTFTYTAAESGTFYLDVYAAAGSGSYSVTYSITSPSPPPSDVTPPTTRLLNLTTTGWVNHDVTLTLQAGDDRSGVQRTEYKLGAAAWTAYAGPITITSEGENLLSYRSVDNAGNTEVAQTAAVRIDKTGPLTRATRKLTVKRKKRAVFRFRVDDRTAKAKVVIKIYKGKKLKMQLKGVGWKATNSVQKYTWRKCTLKKGTYIWKVYATDEAGNVQSKMVTKKLVVK